MKRPALLVRDAHPTLETFERVLDKGVVVDCGPEDRRRALWATASVAGNDLLGFDADLLTCYLFDEVGRRRRDDDE